MNPVEVKAPEAAVEAAEPETAFQSTFDAFIAEEIPLPAEDALEHVVDEEVIVHGNYLEDTDEVKAAKVAFKFIFDAYANGEVPQHVPIDEPAVAAAKAAFQ